MDQTAGIKPGIRSNLNRCVRIGRLESLGANGAAAWAPAASRPRQGLAGVSR